MVNWLVLETLEVDGIPTDLTGRVLDERRWIVRLIVQLEG